MAVESEHVTADVIEATEFPDLSRRYGVRGVPKIVINETTEFVGALPEAEIWPTVEPRSRRMEEVVSSQY
jgi:hypothetical protein